MTTTSIASTATSVPSAMDSPKVGMPVTIITGFLGSGKTTLLNHILTNQQGVKTAVLVNEFGEIGIDNELIINSGSDDSMIELSNGCICCTINNDLLDAVFRVLERPEKVDYLVVETTGLADPLPVALTFLGTELRDLTRVDSIVTVVDAANFSVDLFNGEVAHNQLLYGDVILLNKTDLVEEADLDLLEVKIRDIKKDARILRTRNAEVPLPLVLSVGLFQSDDYFDAAGGVQVHGKTSDSSHKHDAHAHDHKHNDQGHKHDDHKHDDHGHSAHDHSHDDHGHDHSHDDHSNCDHDHGKCEHDHGHGHDHGHDHDHGGNPDQLMIEGFTSLSFQSDRPFEIRKFQYFLDNQISSNVFRAKGILWFDESQKRHVFHLSGKRFTLDDTEWTGPKKNQLVLIGQNMDHDKLRSQINHCLTTDKSSAGKGFGR
jgi:G3E family GTPase